MVARRHVRVGRAVRVDDRRAGCPHVRRHASTPAARRRGGALRSAANTPRARARARVVRIPRRGRELVLAFGRCARRHTRAVGPSGAAPDRARARRHVTALGDRDEGGGGAVVVRRAARALHPHPGDVEVRE